MTLIRSLLLFVVSMTIVLPVAADELIYQQYFELAQKRAAGLVAMYYGAQKVVIKFDNGPAGTFRVATRDTGTGDEKVFYMLSDMQHLLEGQLLSQLFREPASAKGIASLERIIEGNIQRDQLIAGVKAQVTQPVRGGTAASILKTPNTKLAKSAPQSVEPLTPLLTPKSTNAELYESLGKLHFAELGDGQNIVYMFIDHNCPACINMHQEIKKMDIPKSVTVRYIPVGFLGEDSEMKASYALSINNEKLRHQAIATMLTKQPLNDLVIADAEPEKVQEGWKRFRDNTLAFFQMPTPSTPFVAANIDGRYLLTPMADPVKFKQVLAQFSVNGSEMNQ